MNMRSFTLRVVIVMLAFGLVNAAFGKEKKEGGEWSCEFGVDTTVSGGCTDKDDNQECKICREIELHACVVSIGVKDCGKVDQGYNNSWDWEDWRTFCYWMCTYINVGPMTMEGCSGEWCPFKD